MPFKGARIGYYSYGKMKQTCHASIHSCHSNIYQTNYYYSLLLSFSDARSEFAVVTRATRVMRMRGGLNKRETIVPPGRETDIVGIISLHDAVSVIEQVYLLLL